MVQGFRHVHVLLSVVTTFLGGGGEVLEALCSVNGERASSGMEMEMEAQYTITHRL